MRRAFVIALVSAAIGSAVQAPSGAEPAPPVPRVISLDVLASDARGRSVDTLKPTDFEVIENGTPRAVDSVRFVRIDAGRAPAEEATAVRSEFDEQQEASREGTRLFAILLDEYHVSAGAAADRTRDALLKFVDTSLGPRDLVAVLKPLDSLLTIRATHDREALRHAIETFEGRKGEYEPRNAFERNFIAGAPSRIEQVRTQVSTSAVSALVVHLGKLGEGRKTVLVASEGFGRTARRRGLEGLPSIDSIVRAANRYNVSIYAMDPRTADADDTAGDPDGVERETLETLTDGTDGRTLGDASTLDESIRQMVSDSSAYYLVNYRSPQQNDGQFHAVTIRVKKTGVRLRSRKGYWAYWPDEALAADMLARLDAGPTTPPLPPAFSLPWHTSTAIRPWFGVARGEGGKTRLTFVWEPAARVPGDRIRRPVAARVRLTAFAPDGTQLFHGTVCAAGSQACSESEDGARAVFDAAPGRVRLQMSIEDAGEQPIDSDLREIAVRDLKGPAALGTAEILRTRIERQFRSVEADSHAAPTAAREFSRAEHLIVRFPAYTADGRPRVSVRLVNRVGQTLRELPVSHLPAPDDRYEADVSLASLAPSEYFFELTVAGAAGEAKDLIGFRVTN